MNILEELVFAIPTDKLWNLLNYTEQGFIKGDNEVLKSIIQKGQFQKRNKLEEDPSFKQIIPYALISFQGSFYLFKRTNKQDEARLHNKFSLGVGGHMNPGKPVISAEQFLINELKKEFYEEVELLNDCFIKGIEFLGFINDDTISVGRVHIGFLYSITLSSKDVKINETDMMTADWIEKNELAQFYGGMETWSKIAIDYFIKLKKQLQNKHSESTIKYH